VYDSAYDPTSRFDTLARWAFEANDVREEIAALTSAISGLDLPGVFDDIVEAFERAEANLRRGVGLVATAEV
jgi:hypothetical protein